MRTALLAIEFHRLEARSARTVTVRLGAPWWTYRIEPSPPGATGKV